MTFVVGCCDVAGVSGGKDSRFGSVSRSFVPALISPALSHRRFDLRSFARLSFFRPSFLFGEIAQTRHETFSRRLSEQCILRLRLVDFEFDSDAFDYQGPRGSTLSRYMNR